MNISSYTFGVLLSNVDCRNAHCSLLLTLSVMNYWAQGAEIRQIPPDLVNFSVGSMLESCDRSNNIPTSTLMNRPVLLQCNES